MFLFALGLSVGLQALSRFVHVEVVEHPLYVLIAGCIGLGLNLASFLILGCKPLSISDINVMRSKKSAVGDNGATVHLLTDFSSRTPRT